jgi:Zn-dependent protease
VREIGTHYRLQRRMRVQRNIFNYVAVCLVLAGSYFYFPHLYDVGAVGGGDEVER